MAPPRAEPVAVAPQAPVQPVLVLEPPEQVAQPPEPEPREPAPQVLAQLPRVARP